MSERESRDAARSLSVVHYMERDLSAAAGLAASLVERSGASEGKPSLLAVLPTPDDVLAFSEAVLELRRDSGTPLTPLTSPSRARRILAAGTSSIAADARTVARLVAESRLDIAQVQTLVLVWPEETLRDDNEREFLERVVAEVPRTAVRVAISAGRTTELAQFLERSMWRAREIEHSAPVQARASVPLRVASVPASERTRAVRSVLDAFDPDTTALITFSDPSEGAARDAAALLGPSVQVVRGVPDRRFNLGIVFDDVPAADELTALAATVDELIAVIRPSQLTALQRVATNVTPIAWTGALANARLTLDALRDEIRGYVATGGHTSWIAVVEPLLDGLDPVEVAAATLALLDRERRKTKRAAAQPPAAAAAPERPTRDERPPFQPRPGRRDDDRGRSGRSFEKKRPWSGDARGGGERSRGPRRDVADRPSRDQRDARPPRDARGAERGKPRDDIERVPRAAHEGREWSERGERLRNSRRGPRGREAE